MSHKQTQARLPLAVYKWLVDRAKHNNRSMNGELVKILLVVMQTEDKEAEQAAQTAQR